MRRHNIAALTLGGMSAVMITCVHALPVSEWQCGDITVQIITTRGDPEETRVTLTGRRGFQNAKKGKGFDIHFKWSGEGRPVRMLDITGWTGGKAYLNGKRCKEYVQETSLSRARE